MNLMTHWCMTKNTNVVDINNDITTKWIVLNSIGEKTQDIVQRSNKTAFELWKILKRSFTKNINTRKLELKNKLDNLKYNPEVDINIFISGLQNTIDELEKIDNDIKSSVKVGILNRSLPEELHWINVFQFKMIGINVVNMLRMYCLKSSLQT